MSTLSAVAGVYPERLDGRPGKLERLFNALKYSTGGRAAGGQHLRKIVAATDTHSATLVALSDAELRARADSGMSN
jgi:hypothetical protein